MRTAFENCWLRYLFSSITPGDSITVPGRCWATVFPAADIPVVQLRIDETRAPEFHYQVGKLLAPLRDEGVLIIGSGNLVHNLHTYAWGKREVQPFDWAVRFEKLAREL